MQPSHSDTCRHGLVGLCPDCPPARIDVSAGTDDVGAPWAAVLRKRDWPWVVVRRTKMDGSMDWVTWHLTRWGARRAVERYRRTGQVRGIRP